VMCRL